MKVALVEWVDAHGHPGFIDRSEMVEHHTRRIVRSVGLVFMEDEKGITLAGCMDDVGEFDRHLFVPKEMIISILRLEA